MRKFVRDTELWLAAQRLRPPMTEAFMDSLKQEGILHFAVDRRYPAFSLRTLEVAGKNRNQSFEVIRWLIWTVDGIPLRDWSPWADNRAADLLWLQVEGKRIFDGAGGVESVVREIQSSRHARHLVDKRRLGRGRTGADVELAVDQIRLLIDPSHSHIASVEAVERATGVELVGRSANIQPDQGVSVVERAVSGLREAKILARTMPLRLEAARQWTQSLILEEASPQLSQLFQAVDDPIGQRMQRGIFGLLFETRLAIMRQGDRQNQAS